MNANVFVDIAVMNPFINRVLQMYIKGMIHSLRTVQLQAAYATVIIARFCWTIVSEQRQKRPLDSKTSTTMSRRFDLKLLRVFSKNRLPGKLHFTIFHQKS